LKFNLFAILDFSRLCI